MTWSNLLQIKNLKGTQDIQNMYVQIKISLSCNLHRWLTICVTFWCQRGI